MFYQQGAKRAIDIAGALIGLLLLLPFIPIVGLAIKLDSSGPIFVALPRVSRGRVVRIVKFRSMVAGAHGLKPMLAAQNERRDGPFFKIRHDPRVTRVGRVIRRFRLDEFPQLWNVLRGELALVGPRPHEPEEVARYPEEFRRLAQATAGVTGLSQVSGASALPFLRELALDKRYVREQSLALDLKILGRTIGIILFDHNAV